MTIAPAPACARRKARARRPTVRLTHRVEADQLDPITVGILDEGDVRGAVLHRSRLARDLGALLLEFGADRVDVVDAERQVAEAGAELIGLLAAPVEGELEHRVGVLRPVADEGVGELATRIIVPAQQLHAEISV